MSYPFDDDYMIYDYTRRQYRLTLDGVTNLLNVNLVEKVKGDETEAELILLQVSDDVYNYIANYSLYSAYLYKKWLIAKDADLREQFKVILADQLRYYIRSGAGVLGDMHGVNIEKGRALSLNSIRGDVMVSASVERKLKQLGLMYGGRMYYNDFSDDTTW